MSSLAVCGETDSAVSRLTSPWREVNAWLDLLPTIFITVGGWIQVGTGPVAFRFTALAEDSLTRRLARIAFSFLIVLLISTRFQRVLRVALK
jgi:hypothetical protein